MRSVPLLACLLPLALGPLTGGCAAQDGEYFDSSAEKQDNATGLRWQVPAEVLLHGDATDVTYTGAGPWNGSSSCQGGMTPGAEALIDYLTSRYPQIDSVGGYACRSIVGRSSETSVHSTGRALDIMLPVGFRAEADNRSGDPIGNFLIANADAIGIQFVIWDRTSWGAHRSAGKKERYYSGQHPHNDHLHVELSEEGGQGLTRWLVDASWAPVLGEGEGTPVPEPEPEPEPAPVDTEPTPIDELPEEPIEDEPEEPAPSVPPLGDPLPEESQPIGCTTLGTEGGIIDRSSNCLWLRGPADYWQHEALGHDSELAWTAPLQSGKHLSSAEWEINIAKEGIYDVDVYVEPEFGTHDAARYYVTHAGATTPSTLDMSSGDGWTRLGSYAFAEGGDQRLTLFDNNDEPVEEGRRIVVDAIRLTPQNEEPVEPEEPDVGEPSDPGDPSEPSVPEPEEETPEGQSGGVVVSGCQAAPGRSSTISFLFIFVGLLALRRRSCPRHGDRGRSAIPARRGPG